MDAMQNKYQFALVEFVYLDAGKNQIISQHSAADLNSFLRGGMQDDNAFSKYVLLVIGESMFVRMPNCSFSTQ